MTLAAILLTSLSLLILGFEKFPEANDVNTNNIFKKPSFVEGHLPVNDIFGMDGHANYFGATLFWLYIFAAPFFSSVVISTILSIPQSKTPQPERRKSDVQLFSALACVSFATLSYNMLNVLIDSFNIWSKQLGSRGDVGMMESIWTWSITSTLFRDFGEAIIENQSRYLWAQSALLATLSVCVYMGQAGSRRQVPRLWAFFCLSQILPISFAQNLLYLALLRLPETKSRAVVRRGPLMSLVGTYISCLVFAPHAKGTTGLMQAIIVARILLLMPLSLVTSEGEIQVGGNKVDDDMLDTRAVQKLIAGCGFLLTLWHVYTLMQDKSSSKDVVASLFSHPAVSALGCDLLLCLLSFILWNSRERVDLGTLSDSKSL